MGTLDRAALPFPARTYAAVLDEDGQIVSEHVFRSEEQDVRSAPVLPSGHPGSTTGGTEAERLTLDGQDHDASYRTLALAFEDGGTRVVATPLTDVEGTLGRPPLIEAAVTVGVLAALAPLAWWLVRHELRPLERMGDTAGAITAGDGTRRVVSGPRTGVSRLAISLNTMLGRPVPLSDSGSGSARPGLSIVAAPAEAHVGVARYHRAFGGGARSEVRIPIA
jgi:two-component system OmpR family sensor kinase